MVSSEARRSDDIADATPPRVSGWVMTTLLVFGSARPKTPNPSAIHQRGAQANTDRRPSSGQPSVTRRLGNGGALRQPTR